MSKPLCCHRAENAVVILQGYLARSARKAAMWPTEKNIAAVEADKAAVAAQRVKLINHYDACQEIAA
jgi:hypothetical protein